MSGANLLFLLASFVMALYNCLQLHSICYNEVCRKHDPYSTGDQQQEEEMAPGEVGHHVATTTELKVLHQVEDGLPESQ